MIFTIVIFFFVACFASLRKKKRFSSHDGGKYLRVSRCRRSLPELIFGTLVLNVRKRLGDVSSYISKAYEVALLFITRVLLVTCS